MLAVYAGMDDRVNASRDGAVAALEAAGLDHEVRTFAGTGHAFFFNDTGPCCDEAAATGPTPPSSTGSGGTWTAG